MMSKWFNRIVAGILILTLAFVSPMQFVGSEAAGKNVKYIKEFKLFIKKEGTQADAENWCKSQTDGDWHVVDGDLNGGTDATYTKPVGVFMCYCTTENEKEAVRNITVMNEKGNYSENAYQEILKSQKSVYKDLVNDLKIQVKGYQENLKNKVNTAVRTHDLLNGYREDDSGKLLGDLLAELDLDQEKDADKLTDILLQANGDVVLFIQQELSLACENAKRSWLDRMVQAGGYDKFYAKIKTAFNGDDSLAKKNMDIKYKEKATVIADDWDNLKSHLNHIKEYEEQNGVSSMSEEQLKTWKANNLKSPNGAIYEQEVALAYNLANYKYEGKTLLDFFSQDKSEISEKNLYKLYPMVACLQDGQFAGLDSTVNLYALINQAFSATLLNDYDKGLLKEVKDEMNEEQKKSSSTAQKNLESITDKQTDKAVDLINKEFKRSDVITRDVLVNLETMEDDGSDAAKEALEFLYKQPNNYRTRGNILMGLSIGLSIIFILASAADIALSVIALRDYYNREHLPIPKRMVDMSTNKEKETSYVVYKTVRDNSGEPGDLNGGSSKQWLALYQTYDDRAGQPILAPESGASMKVVYGENRADNLSPLHMFGTPTVLQNLTFADGEEGWSYNDNNNGTYLFFSRSGDKVIEEEEKEVVSEKKDEAASENADEATSEAVSGSAVADEDQTGTAISGGYIILIAAGVLIIAFCVILYTRKRGKREEE